MALNASENILKYNKNFISNKKFGASEAIITKYILLLILKLVNFDKNHHNQRLNS